MKTRTTIIILCLVFIAGLSACKGKKNGADSPLPDESPLPGLFGIWELTATHQSNDCPTAFMEGMETPVTEEYRVFQNAGGCAIDDEKEDGTSLLSEEVLFDDEETTCGAGGDTLILEQDYSATEMGCAYSIKRKATLKLANNALSGGYTLDVNATGTSCSSAFQADPACAVRFTVAGVQVTGGGVVDDDGDNHDDETLTPPPGTEALKLRIQIAKYRMAGTTCPVTFSLCDNAGACFQSVIEDDLARGEFYEFEFTDADALSGSVPLADLSYSDGEYSSINFSVSDDCTATSPGIQIGGVELLEKDVGSTDEYKSVYRNPCIDRWIIPSAAWNHFSLGFTDDAWCFTIKTYDCSTCDTVQSAVYVDIKQTSPITIELDDFLYIYRSSSTRIPESYLDNQIEGYLPVFLNHKDYLDWTPDATDSYGFTINGQGKMESKVRLRINSDNAWKVDTLRAVHFKPGDRGFLDDLACKKAVPTIPGHCLSTNDDDCGGDNMEALPTPTTFYSLTATTCSDFDSIRCADNPADFCKSSDTTTY